MGLEQALTQGLLGMVGGGAKVIQEQEQAGRENAAKQADEAARTERELAIEERKLALRSDYDRRNQPFKLEQIEAEGKARARGERNPLDDQIKQRQLARLVEEDKLPGAVKVAYQSNMKELENIGSAMNKAMADGTWDESSSGAQSLLKRQAELTRNTQSMISPYLPKTEKAEPTESAKIDLSSFDKSRPAQAQAQAPAKPAKAAMSETDKLSLIERARSIKSKYGGNIPSRYMSGALSPAEQRVIDAADAASPNWSKF